MSTSPGSSMQLLELRLEHIPHDMQQQNDIL